VQDGTYNYVWDGENRLIEAAVSSPAEGDPQVVFAYDYLGRRVCRQVYRWDPAAAGGAGDWAGPVEDRRVVYDGWNVLVELDGLDYDEDGWPDNLVVRRLTWGLDLAGQAGDAEQSRDREGAVGGLASAGGVASGGAIPGLQGAGGIGGLLGADDANGTPGVTGDDEQYVFFYDAQGNVGQLVKDAVQPLARYEYDAYGRTIGPDVDGDGDWTDDAGPFAVSNPFRFSTKYYDGALADSAPADAGLYDYGYRYYSPRLGRWLSREPLGEDASANLYIFVLNNPNHFIDTDGRMVKNPSQPSSGSSSQPTSQPAASQPEGGAFPGAGTKDDPRDLSGMIDELEHTGDTGCGVCFRINPRGVGKLDYSYKVKRVDPGCKKTATELEKDFKILASLARRVFWLTGYESKCKNGCTCMNEKKLPRKHGIVKLDKKNVYLEYQLFPIAGPKSDSCTGDLQMEAKLDMDGWYGECKKCGK